MFSRTSLKSQLAATFNVIQFPQPIKALPLLAYKQNGYLFSLEKTTTTCKYDTLARMPYITYSFHKMTYFIFFYYLIWFGLYNQRKYLILVEFENNSYVFVSLLISLCFFFLWSTRQTSSDHCYP